MGRIYLPSSEPAAEAEEPATEATAEETEEPAGNASRADWAAYAASQGAPEEDTGEDGLTRDELRDKYGA